MINDFIIPSIAIVCMDVNALKTQIYSWIDVHYMHLVLIGLQA